MSVMPAPVDACPEVDAELTELIRLLPSVIGALWRARPRSGTLHHTFADHRLGPRHARMLIIVAFMGEINVTALATWLGLSRSATSLLVGELTSAGVLTREPDDRDKRRTLVRVDPAHEAAAQAWLSQWLAPWVNTLSRLSARDRAGFVAGWRVLQGALGAHQAST